MKTILPSSAENRESLTPNSMIKNSLPYRQASFPFGFISDFVKFFDLFVIL